MLENLGRSARILLLGGTSEIGLAILAALALPADSRVLLAGRDEARLVAAGKELPFAVSTVAFDALELDTHKAIVDQIFAEGPVDLVIAAIGILTPQEEIDRDPILGGRMIDVNFTSHVTTLVEAAAKMRAQRHGTIVVLSSIAAIRPRKANFVYGAAKAGLDAFAGGLADAMAGTGVRVLLVRPGFVRSEPGSAIVYSRAGGRRCRGGARRQWVGGLDPAQPQCARGGPSPRATAAVAPDAQVAPGALVLRRIVCRVGDRMRV